MSKKRLAVVVATAIIASGWTVPQAFGDTFEAGGRSYVVETDTIPANADFGTAQAVCPS